MAEIPPVRVGTTFTCSKCQTLLAKLVSVPESGALSMDNFKVYGPMKLHYFQCFECGSDIVDIFIPDPVGREKVIDPMAGLH